MAYNALRRRAARFPHREISDPICDMPPHNILTQSIAIRCMLGGSIGIAVLETQLSQNTQIVHSRLIEHLRPDNPLAQAPYLTAPFSLTDPIGDRRTQSRGHPPSGNDRL